MRLPDPQRSYAVLIGTSTYHFPQLADLPAVRNNLDALAKILTDQTLGWLPAERCIVLSDPTNVREVYRTLRRYAAFAEDTLLVYFAGHGRTGPRNELYLGLTDTDPDELRVSALPFDLIREVFGDSPATNRVLILDCCFSGRAIQDMSGPDEAILGQIGVEGTYTLTSASANAVALAPIGADYTAFTGELITLLHTGIPNGPELITFATVYRQLLQAMTNRGLPRPGQRGTGTVDQLAVTRNAANLTNRPPTPPVGRVSPHASGTGTVDQLGLTRNFAYLTNRPPTPPVGRASFHASPHAPPDHGVEFREQHKPRSIAWAITAGLVVIFLIIFYFYLLATENMGSSPNENGFWIPIALFVLMFSLGFASSLLEILTRPRLVIDSSGITKHYADNNYKRRQVHLPWSELSTVETRRQGTALILLCVPKPGSGLYADEQAEKLRSESLRGYVVIDLTTLDRSPDTVTTALVRYSGGRYRPEKSSL